MAIIFLSLLNNVSLPLWPWYIQPFVSHLPKANKLCLFVGTYNTSFNFRSIIFVLWHARRMISLCPSTHICLPPMSPFNITPNHVMCLKSDDSNKLAHHVSTK